MHPEAGSTTFEALAAVLILGIVFAAAAAAASSGLRAFRAAGPAASAAVRALAVDDGVRRVAERIRIPWWDLEARAESLSPGLAVGYLEGRKDARLSLTPSDRGLVLAEGEESRLFEGVELVSVRTVPEDGGPPRGLALDYRTGGRDFRTLAAFGAWALGEDGR